MRCASSEKRCQPGSGGLGRHVSGSPCGTGRQRRPGTKARGGERLALYVDLENLLHECRQARDWDGAILALAALVHRLAARGTLVARIAFGDAGLVRRVAFGLGGLGIRSHVHEGGENGADLALLEVLNHEVPVSCDTVVIASGDHIFAPVARRLRAEGRRVEIVARPGTISSELYVAGDAFSAFTTFDDEIAQLTRDKRHQTGAGR